MDFASLMKSQIAASSSNGATESGKKYLKRSEVEAQRQAEYLREQEQLEQARLEKLDKKRKRDEEEAERNQAREDKRQRLAAEGRRKAEDEAEAEERERRKRLGLPELEKNDEASRSNTPLREDERDIEDSELLEYLKELGEPRRLFGETHIQRLRRYRQLTGKAITQPTMTNGPIPTTLQLVPEADMQVPASVPTDTEDRKYLLRQIASYFDMLLSEWAAALSRRSKEVKDSFTGKQALQNHHTALSNLTPLFRKLESDSLPASLLTPILEITRLAQEKRYVDANDAYLRLSIGKAAWPIGVTMVGIHERSAREKLHETEKGKGDDKAHIMSDEVTRKMLQGIKRCLSYAQTKWPPDDLGQLMG